MRQNPKQSSSYRDPYGYSHSEGARSIFDESLRSSIQTSVEFGLHLGEQRNFSKLMTKR